MFLVFVLTLCVIGINANQSICDVCLRECSVFDTTLRQVREEIKENKKAIDGKCTQFTIYHTVIQDFILEVVVVNAW